MAGRKDLKLVKNKIEMFRQRLNDEGLGDASLILFGSWAKGKQQEFSDIDLCVVSNKFSGNTFNAR
jgi:predicted nucleotidyltransferase